MKVMINKSQLMYGINSVIRATASKPSNVILTGIRIVAEDNHLVFTATDLNIVSNCTVPAEVESAGGVVVPGKIFSELVKKLPDINIELVLENEELAINYFVSSASIKVFPYDEFPNPENNDVQTITIPGGILRNALKQVSFATGDDVASERQVFTGVFFHTEGDQLKLAATDTHRICMKSIDAITNGIVAKALVPEKTVNEVFRLVREDTETVEVGFGENFATFKFGDISIFTRLVAGNFPDYPRVIPASTSKQVTVKTKDMNDSVERASLLTSNKLNVIQFEFDKDISLTSGGEKGKVSEKVKIVSHTGSEEKMVINFNPQFYIDVLKVVDTEDVIVETTESLGPALIRPVGDNSYLYLMLPARVA